jgi:hypothetical protein
MLGQFAFLAMMTATLLNPFMLVVTAIIRAYRIYSASAKGYL